MPPQQLCVARVARCTQRRPPCSSPPLGTPPADSPSPPARHPLQIGFEVQHAVHWYGLNVEDPAASTPSQREKDRVNPDESRSAA